MDDSISRKAAIEAMRECWRRVNQFAKPFEANRIMDCINAVKELPAVDAVPVEWLREKMQKPQTTCANPFGFVLDEWLEEQEGR